MNLLFLSGGVVLIAIAFIVGLCLGMRREHLHANGRPLFWTELPKSRAYQCVFTYEDRPCLCVFKDYNDPLTLLLVILPIELSAELIEVGEFLELDSNNTLVVSRKKSLANHHEARRHLQSSR